MKTQSPRVDVAFGVVVPAFLHLQVSIEHAPRSTQKYFWRKPAACAFAAGIFARSGAFRRAEVSYFQPFVIVAQKQVIRLDVAVHKLQACKTSRKHAGTLARFECM